MVWPETLTTLLKRISTPAEEVFKGLRVLGDYNKTNIDALDVVVDTHDAAIKALLDRPVGTVLHVADTGGSDANDGLSWDKAFKTIQAAVDGATDGAGDIIKIAPGQYNENVLIKGKNRLSLIGVPIANKETRIRASGAEAGDKLVFTPVGEAAVEGCCIAIMSTCVQIANLTLDASGHYVGIYLGDGGRIGAHNEDANGAWIHDNFFKYGDWGIALDGCSEDHKIEDNIIYRQEYGGMHIAPGANRTVQRVYVVDNVFVADASGYGVYMYNADTVRTCHFRANSFLDGTHGETGAALAFTNPIKLQGAGVHTVVDNFFACANPLSVSATDYVVGNYPAKDSEFSVYIDVADLNVLGTDAEDLTLAASGDVILKRVTLQTAALVAGGNGGIYVCSDVATHPLFAELSGSALAANTFYGLDVGHKIVSGKKVQAKMKTAVVTSGVGQIMLTFVRATDGASIVATTLA